MIPFQLAILRRLGARELRPYARFAGPRGSLAQGSRLVHRVPLPLRRFRTSLAYGPVNPSNSSASSQIPGFPRAGEPVSQAVSLPLRRSMRFTSVGDSLLVGYLCLFADPGFPSAGELVSPSGTSASSQVHEVHLRRGQFARRVPLPLRRSWVSLMQGSWLVRRFLCLFADPRFPSRRGVG